MKKIIVVGSSNTDMVVTSPKLPLPGETIMGSHFDVIAGGKGANQAVAAARAGGRVTFIAKVGNDNLGQKAIEGYKADDIDTSGIFIDEDNPSGVAVILVNESNGQNSIVVAPGANGNLSVEDIQKAEHHFAEAGVLLIQLEIPIPTVTFALQTAKKYGLTTILNPAPAQALDNELLQLVDIITPNETETHILVGILPEDDESIRNAAALLLDKVNESAIITLGSKGAYYASKNGHAGIIPTNKVNAVDTTAAGDVFNGYLAAALTMGKSLEQAIVMANKAASFSVTRKGAQPSIPKMIV